MKLFAKGMLFLLLLSFAGNAMASVEGDYRRVKEEYRNLLDSSRKQMYRENWTRIIDGFLDISRTHPRHDRAPDALYMAGKAGQGLYRVSGRLEDARRAAEYFDRLSDEYPQVTLADDALVLSAAIHKEILGDKGAAWERYDRAVRRHPQGDQAALAGRKSRELARYAPAPAEPARISAVRSTAESRSSGPVELTGLRFWSNPGYTRVVLDLSGPADYTANFLPENSATGLPPRLYVDVAGAVPGSELMESTAVGDGLLRQIRTGRPAGDSVRVVLDLVSFEDYKVFPLDDPRRIVLDVRGKREPGSAADHPGVASLPGVGDEIGQVLETALSEKPLKIQLPPGESAPVLRRIVVDAGHGGKDPGAVGRGGTLEKDVTLAMARALARRLKKDLDCEVILTRDGDVYLPLEERTAIANRVGADLFISVHANASPSSKAYGVETYYLNFSKNDKAAAVAARENGTSLKQVGDLELILFDLMANSKINESSRLAAEIQKNLVDVLGGSYSHIKDLGVRQGPFYVLLGATMPSVLVETAFISHKREELRLKDPGYHEKTAAAISLAVRNYADSQRMIAGR